MARILVPRITPQRSVRRGHSRFSLSLIFLLALFSVRGWSQSLVIKDVTVIDATGRAAAPHSTVAVSYTHLNIESVRFGSVKKFAILERRGPAHCRDRANLAFRQEGAHLFRDVSIEQYPQRGDLWRTPGWLLPDLAAPQIAP